MVDSVNPGSGTPPISPTPETTTDSTEEKSGVSSGYSSEDTVSFSSEGETDSQSQDSLVGLDSPSAVSTSDARDFLRRTYESKLSGFRTIVSDFNARFKADEVDLSDTKSLLLAIKGMVSDVRTLLNAETIDYSSSSRSYEQQRRLDTARNQKEIKAEIKERNDQIQNANEQIASINQELAAKNQSKLAKENAITQNSNSGDASLVSRLKAELAEIEATITQLQESISPLNIKIQGLEAANVTSQERLTQDQTLVANISENLFNARQLLGWARERFDGEATHTGEDEVAELKRENRAAEIQLDKNEKRLTDVKQNMKEVDGEIWDDQIKAADKQTEKNTSGLIPGVISPAQIKTLATLFPPEDPLLILQKLRETPGQPSPQQLSDASEALALILQATPPQMASSVTASEAKPGEDPHLGDNLSLEGAGNPQAFALLLLQKNMEVLKDNVGDQSQLAALEIQQNAQIDNLMNELQKVETMVADALEESEKADAVIRRSPV